MSDALEHVRYSCGIAGEEVANYVDQLQARVAELEAGVERLSAAHVKARQAKADSQAELAKAEQRVAEAFIEYMVDLKQQDFAFTGSTTIGIEKCETAIRSGEYRKFMKEV